MIATVLGKFILASGSPRRKSLLEALGLDFETQPALGDEILPGDPASADFVERLALLKAFETASRNPDDEAVVLGADTCIDWDGRVLGKPRDAEHAVEMLMSLTGRAHQVLTGVALLQRPSGRARCNVVSTGVRMRPFSMEEAQRYVESGEPMDKAGAYAIQGRGASLLEGIDGCFNNVVGLPLCEVAGLYRELTAHDWIVGGPHVCHPTCPRATLHRTGSQAREVTCDLSGDPLGIHSMPTRG